MTVCVAECSSQLEPDLTASDGRIVRCPDCRSLRILNVEPIDPRAYGRAYSAGSDPRKSDACAALFERLTEGRKPGRLLDLGCGDGGFMERAAARGWTPTGLDLDEQAVNKSRERGFEAVRGHADSSASLGTGFDVVTAFDLIEHVEDPREMIRLIARVLRPGGIALIVTPNSGSLLDRVARAEYHLTRGRSTRILDLCLNRYHLHRFSGPGLARAFERAGLETVLQEEIALYSLGGAQYGRGFAPGIAGWTGHDRIDRMLSMMAFGAIRLFGVSNKLLHVASKSGGDAR